MSMNFEFCCTHVKHSAPDAHDRTAPLILEVYASQKKTRSSINAEWEPFAFKALVFVYKDSTHISMQDP